MPFEIDAKHSGRDDAGGEERGATKSTDANRRDGGTSELMRPRRDGRAERKPADRSGDREPRDKGAQKGTDERTKGGEARSLLMRHPYMAIAAAPVVVLCVVAGTIWWLNARQYESTDDAFIDARTVSISSQVGGAIVDVPVTDNQRIDEGALLARIDDRDYRAAVDLAVAQIDQAEGNIANLDAQIDAQQARIDQAHKQVTEAQAALSFAKDEDVRAQDLVRKGAGTLQRAQQTASDLRQKRAAYDGAEANAVAAEKQIEVLKTQRQATEGQLEQARATKEQADANLARTAITAPVEGFVTKLTAAKGAYAQIGQSLMMFVPRAVWVTANFKETQLADMREGQAVTINVDAYPDHAFRGRIESIQAGSGAAFSLLPPENATGNFVKVIQRVPVKIAFEGVPDVYLGPGMSVVPDVKVR